MLTLIISKDTMKVITLANPERGGIVSRPLHLPDTLHDNPMKKVVLRS